MKRLFKFKYPKIALLIVAIILAYYIFRQPAVAQFLSSLGTLKYLGVYLAGMLISFGFTAPFSVGFFIALTPENIWIATIIGGLGAMTSDVLILKFIRFSFQDEFDRIRKTKTFNKINFFFNQTLGKMSVYLMYVFAGILIASPLPDEAGVTILAGITKIKVYTLAIIGFVLNSLGIFILLNL